MDKNEIIRKAEEFTREKMKKFDPGHDWWHIVRVRRIAEYINSLEKSADSFILDLAAILHDVADSKFSSSKDPYFEIEAFLNENVSEELKIKVLNAIKNISFSNRNPHGDLADPVFQILQDADRLDAIGAIGIARAFSYGSFKGNRIYEPSDEQGGKRGTTIFHFYEKLLKLKGLMNTGTGKVLAGERHEFLKVFLDHFFLEWDLKDATKLQRL